jgi:activator of HSP90 ATPase
MFDRKVISGKTAAAREGLHMAADNEVTTVTTRRRVIGGLSAGAATWAILAAPGARSAGDGDGGGADSGGEVVHNMEAIHQEVTFKASRERVYEALLDAREFHKVVLLSGAVQSGMVKAPKPSEISREPGGAFAVFGGFIVGRQIELVANTRIVQAWRPLDWAPGVYSIARFGLAEHEHGTRLTFDHTGFPKGQAEHLAQGWKVNYWRPLEKVLS